MRFPTDWIQGKFSPSFPPFPPACGGTWAVEQRQAVTLEHNGTSARS